MPVPEGSPRQPRPPSGNVYLREADVLPAIDRWLTVIFAPRRLAQTIAEMQAAQAPPATPEPAATARDTRATLADCDARLARYQATLDAGGDPQTIAEWTRQVKAERAAALARDVSQARHQPGRRLTEAMECLFPGSSGVSRRFAVEVAELRPGAAVTVAGVTAAAWEVDHPSGAPALALRLALGGKVVAYTGDTAWTDALTEVAGGADLLIAEAYYRDKAIPYHLRHADLVAHQARLNSRRIVLTHMSADMLAHPEEVRFDTAHDGYVVRI